MRPRCKFRRDKYGNAKNAFLMHDRDDMVEGILKVNSERNREGSKRLV